MPQSVFISYARADDELFAKRLYEDLTEAGFKVWWDRVCMPSRRLTFYQEIADTIRSHDRLILIIGPKASISEYVRQEWQWALQLDKALIPILRKGDYSDVPDELSLLQCDDFRDDTEYRIRLKKLIENLLLPKPPLGALYGVPPLPPHYLGREELLHRVKHALLVDLQKAVVISASDSRVGVQGMGGIGKSVLAVALARDREVRRSYPDGIIWVTVGQQPRLVQLQHDVARHLGSRDHFDTVVQGQGILRQLLAQKAVLLILDDAWKAYDVQAFEVLGPRCRAMVTTRDAGILQTMGGQSVSVSLFTELEALQLVADTIGIERSALPSEVHEIVKECGRLPLAVALCGGMAKKQGGQWRTILKRLRAANLNKIVDRQAINKRHVSIWRAMKASVDILSYEEQKRFAELSIFVTTNPVPEAAVATLWSHTGNLSDLDTTDLLINFAECSLIRLDQKPTKSGQPIQRDISLHDLLYDFATVLTRNSTRLHLTLLDAYRKECPDGWHSGPNDGYFYQYLAHHLSEAKQYNVLEKILFDYQWLRKKLQVTNTDGTVADYDYAPSNSDARLVQNTIRLSSHTLAEDMSHFPSQLCGRLLSQKRRKFKTLLTSMIDNEETIWLRPVSNSLMSPGGPLVRTLKGHTSCVGAVALTSDGQYVVSGSFDHTLRVWDLHSGKVLRILEAYPNCVRSVAVTRDGCHVVSGSDNKMVRVWDLQAGKIVYSLKGHRDRIDAVAVTPDGRRIISGSGDKTLKIWDLQTGELVATLEDHTRRICAVGITPDGRYAVSGSGDKTLKVWDLKTNKVQRTLTGHTNWVISVAITPSGRQVVSGSRDKTLKVWDLRTGKLLRSLKGHEHGVDTLAVTPDGHHLVSGSFDKTLKVWDLGTGKLLRSLKGHEHGVSSLAVTPDGRYVVSGSVDFTLRIWNLNIARAIPILDGHVDSVEALAVTPDGHCAVSGSDDNTLKVWDIQTGKLLRTMEVYGGKIMALAVTPDGRNVVLSPLHTPVEIWDLSKGKKLHTLKHEEPVTSVAVTPDSRFVVSGSWDRKLRVWDLQTGKIVYSLKGHKGGVDAVAVTPDGRYAVSGSVDKTVKIWRLKTGKLLHTLKGSRDIVTALAVTPNGRHVVSSGWETRVWNLRTRRVPRALEGQTSYVYAVAAMPDGHHAVSASKDRTLRIWNLRTGNVVVHFQGDSEIRSCAVTADGRTIVAGEASGRVHFLRLENMPRRGGAKGDRRRIK